MRTRLGTLTICVAIVTTWVIVGLAWAGLSLGLITTDGLARYPAATRISNPIVRFHAGTVGQVRQRSIYYSTDTWREVLGWYARHFDLALDREPQLRGGCFQTAHNQAWLVIGQSVSVTLCARNSSTHIVVDRIFRLYY